MFDWSLLKQRVKGEEEIKYGPDAAGALQPQEKKTKTETQSQSILWRLLLATGFVLPLAIWFWATVMSATFGCQAAPTKETSAAVAAEDDRPSDRIIKLSLSGKRDVYLTFAPDKPSDWVDVSETSNQNLSAYFTLPEASSVALEFFNGAPPLTITAQQAAKGEVGRLGDTVFRLTGQPAGKKVKVEIGPRSPAAAQNPQHR